MTQFARRILKSLTLALPLFLLSWQPAQGQGQGPERIIEGDLKIVHVEDYQRGVSHFEYFVIPRGKPIEDAVELAFSNGAPKSLKPGAEISVRGRGVGRKIWVEDILILSEGGSESTAETTGDPSTNAAVDPHATLVMIVNITGTTSWTATHETDARNVMYDYSDSVDAHYMEGSHGELGFPGDQGDSTIVTVNKVADCPIFSYAGAADAAAQAQGYLSSNYDNLIYIIPQGSVSDCTWLAVGILGSYGSGSTYRSWSTRIDAAALGHELGHNIGWHHAATDPDNDGFLDVEYGDFSDMMGYCCVEKKFNAVHLDQIGWLQSGTILTVVATGPYTLSPLGTDPTFDPTQQVLRLERDASTQYYLSYRQSTGLDSNLSSNYTRGVSIHYGRPSGTWSFHIRTLVDGESWYDPVTGLMVTQYWHDDTGVGLDVSFDACVERAPIVSVTPPEQMMGVEFDPMGANYSVALQSDDSLGCPDETYYLSSTYGVLDDAPVTLAAGAQAPLINLDVNPPMPEGSHLITVTVTKSGSAQSTVSSATLTIDLTAPSAPSNITASKAKGRSKNRINLSWSPASDGGSGVASYRISRDDAEVGTSSGTSYIDNGVDPNVDHSYMIEAVDGAGNFSVPATMDYTAGDGGETGGGGNGNGRGGKKK